MAMRKASPLWWQGHAEALRTSAGVLWAYRSGELGQLSDHYERGYGAGFTKPVYLMLCGMSLEMLFKGVLAARRQKIPNTHRLLDLAHKVRMVTQPSTQTYLEVLTHSIIWSGRYPVPNTAQDWLEEGNLKAKMAGNGTFAEQIRRSEATTGWTAFDQVWMQAYTILNHELPDWEFRGL